MIGMLILLSWLLMISAYSYLSQYQENLQREEHSLQTTSTRYETIQTSYLLFPLVMLLKHALSLSRFDFQRKKIQVDVQGDQKGLSQFLDQLISVLPEHHLKIQQYTPKNLHHWQLALAPL